MFALFIGLTTIPSFLKDSPYQNLFVPRQAAVELACQSPENVMINPSLKSLEQLAQLKWPLSNTMVFGNSSELQLFREELALCLEEKSKQTISIDQSTTQIPEIEVEPLEMLSNLTETSSEINTLVDFNRANILGNIHKILEHLLDRNEDLFEEFLALRIQRIKNISNSNPSDEKIREIEFMLNIDETDGIYYTSNKKYQKEFREFLLNFDSSMFDYDLERFLKINSRSILKPSILDLKNIIFQASHRPSPAVIDELCFKLLRVIIQKDENLKMVQILFKKPMIKKLLLEIIGSQFSYLYMKKYNSNLLLFKKNLFKLTDTELASLYQNISCYTPISSSDPMLKDYLNGIIKFTTQVPDFKK